MKRKLKKGVALALALLFLAFFGCGQDTAKELSSIPEGSWSEEFDTEEELVTYARENADKAHPEGLRIPNAALLEKLLHARVEFCTLGGNTEEGSCRAVFFLRMSDEAFDELYSPLIDSLPKANMDVVNERIEEERRNSPNDAIWSDENAANFLINFISLNYENYADFVSEFGYDPQTLDYVRTEQTEIQMIWDCREDGEATLRMLDNISHYEQQGIFYLRNEENFYLPQLARQDIQWLEQGQYCRVTAPAELRDQVTAHAHELFLPPE